MILVNYLNAFRMSSNTATLASRAGLAGDRRPLRLRAAASVVAPPVTAAALPASAPVRIPSPPTSPGPKAVQLPAASAPLHQLGACTDMTSLRSALSALCARFGAVAQLDVIPMDQPGHPQALCLWRMQSPEAQDRLRREWGVGCFGGELVLVVDMAPATTASGGAVNSVA